MLFILLLFDFLFIFISYNIFKNNKDLKIIMYLFIIGFSIYSGLGIVLYHIDSEIVYLLEFIAFSSLFLGVCFFKKNKKTKILSGLDYVYQNHWMFICIMAIVYLITFIYPLILGGITFEDIKNFASIFSEYTSTPFAVRLARKSDAFYTIMVNQVRSICMPFFYLVIYRFRRNPLKFIVLFLFPVFLKTVADGYISRNNIVVYITFIFVYLVLEEYLNKKIAIIIAIVMIPIGLAVLNVLASLRSGGIFEFSINSIGENIVTLIASECSYPIYYDVCNSMFNFTQTFSFFIYILLVIVPSQFYSIINLTVPNLAYLFTETVLGMSYGALNYYILLPSVLGEAVILFGKYFAWLYGGIYALYVMWFTKILSANKTLKYLKLYFMLDFFRQFRGGSQYVLSTWLTTIIPFIVLVFFLSKFKISLTQKKQVLRKMNSI